MRTHVVGECSMRTSKNANPPVTIRNQQMLTNTGPAAPVSQSAQYSARLKHPMTTEPHVRIMTALDVASMRAAREFEYGEASPDPPLERLLQNAELPQSKQMHLVSYSSSLSS